MDSIIEGFKKAFLLIISLDRELLSIIFLSLKVSGLALFIAIFLGLPTAALTGLKRFPARGFIISLLNALMGLPPVVAGLFAYLLLSRSGPLGFMELLYTPTAMIIVQSVLAFPIIASICNSAIIGVNPLIKLAAATLGATSVQVAFTVIKEARYGIMSGVIAGLGRLMAEVGAVLIVGGNIAGHTRVMTTTIALETDKGNFELAIALGIVLLIISLLINILLYFFQKKGALQSGRDN
jgi:tungstate transport system permease protein